ncbi:hypothetical protein Q5752_000527 [Cryptotrichosporon argae]
MAHAPMPTCSSCYSELRLAPAHIAPCCLRPTCAPCLARNPRLKEYDPCLRCGDVRSAAGARAVARGARERAERERERQNVFVLDDEDNSDGDGEAGGGVGDADERGAPPPYESSGAHGDGDGNGNGSGTGISTVSGDARSEPRRGGGAHGAKRTDDDHDPDTEVVEVVHTLRRGDTLLSIARRHAADPHRLLELNALPHTALSSDPRILRTRRSLLISRQSVPRACAPIPDRPSASASASASEDEGQDEEGDDDERRRADRAVKRFQLLTKTADRALAETYLGVAAIEAAHATGDAKELDKVASAAAGAGARARAGAGAGAEGTEARAADKWFDDERWEHEVGGPVKRADGRWRVVGGVAAGIKG